MSKQTLTLNASVSLLDNANDNEPKRFTALAYSGDIVPNYGYMGNIAIDLSSLINPADTVPLLRDHNSHDLNAIVGNGVLRLQDNALYIDGVLTEATESGKLVAALLQDKHPINLSIGIQASVRELKSPMLINGKTLSVQHVFENATVTEVSFVAVGADRSTNATALNFSQDQTHTNTTKEDKRMELEALQQENTALKAELATLKAEFATQQQQARAAEVTALFNAVGKEVTDESVKPYLAMDAVTFSAIATDMKTMHSAKQAQNSALFSRQTPLSAPTTESKNAGALLLNAVEQLTV